MNVPAALMESLTGLPGFDRERFQAVHAAGEPVTSIRLNPGKPGIDGGVGASISMEIMGALAEDEAAGKMEREEEMGVERVDEEGVERVKGLSVELVKRPGVERVPWSSYGYYLPRRPSFTGDPRFHAGAYYVQEASSMFLEQALRQTTDLSQPLKVLDLCAAPGGKSTLLQSLLPAGSLLVSNEVIRSRVHILEENIVKWGAVNTVITSSDAQDFGRLDNYFDVMVVDAPCSGSGLFRRDPAAAREWSPDAVRLCSQRQQRILADCWPALRQGGLLIYSTCSYSREEDEDIAEWIRDELGAEACPLSVPEEWRIVETGGRTGVSGYRFYPDKLPGEGLYLTCLRKTGGGSYFPGRKKEGIPRLSRKEEATAAGWLRPDAALAFFYHNELAHAIPAGIFSELPALRSACRLVRAGTPLGKISVKEFIPTHDLALGVIAARELPAIDLTREDALRYLRKDELPQRPAERGWMVVRYGGFNLGWIKSLAGRINNYYPKEWRILRREQ